MTKNEKENMWYIWILLGIFFIVFGFIEKQKNDKRGNLWWLGVILAILLV